MPAWQSSTATIARARIPSMSGLYLVAILVSVVVGVSPSSPLGVGGDYPHRRRVPSRFLGRGDRGGGDADPLSCSDLHLGPDRGLRGPRVPGGRGRRGTGRLHLAGGGDGDVGAERRQGGRAQPRRRAQPHPDPADPPPTTT